jgi:type II secretory pathway predicted ATPase ExeA
MLPEVMAYHGIRRDFRQAGFFETAQYPSLYLALKTAITQGHLVAVAGIVGCGKTTLLQRVQAELLREKEILVARSLAVEKDRVTLGTLIMALFYDLATEKNIKIPPQPEKRERQLLDLINKRRKPIALFIDEAHDLHRNTLTELKRLMELVRQQGDLFAVVLAGHPRLKNLLRHPAMEEIGAAGHGLDLRWDSGPATRVPCVVVGDLYGTWPRGHSDPSSGGTPGRCARDPTPNGAVPHVGARSRVPRRPNSCDS